MVTLSINGIDRTNFILTTSLRIENILTQQVDRCTFTIRNPDKTGASFVPVVGNEVIIVDSGTRIFGGVIVRRVDKSPSVGIIDFDIECSDYTRLLDQKLVAETYEGMTVEEIIDDLVSQFAPAGFNTAQVHCTQSVNYIQFKYIQVSECIKQLAELVGYDWYVDYLKNIYFQSPTALSAPIDITDTSGTYVNQSLTIRRDNSQMRNTIIVRGGEYEGSEFTSSVRADGKQYIFNLPYKYSDFGASLTGNPLTIGVDYIDPADNFHALYNFNEKILRFKETDRPNQNATLSFFGKPHLPVVVRVQDDALISATRTAEGQGDGIYEYVIIDKTINTQVAARQRAYAEMQTYGQTLSEGEFETETSGIKAGQRILINSVARNINEYFIVNKVISFMKTPETMMYQISLITTKTMDFIHFLKKLSLLENKNIVITDDEQLNRTANTNETITIAESDFTAQSLNWPVQFVLGPYSPTGFKRVFIIEGGRFAA